MSLTTGDRAHPFQLPHKPKELTDVGALIGHEKVVLLFFPFAFSGVCHDGVCHMRDNWSSYADLGAKVFGITIDSPFVVDKWRAETEAPFPILSDFNKEVSAAYGALHEDLGGLKGVSKRSAFVISEDGTIAYAWVSDDPGVQVDFDAVKAALAGAPAGA